MHSISHGEHLNIPSFKKFLSRNNASEKPFWVERLAINNRFRFFAMNMPFPHNGHL